MKHHLFFVEGDVESSILGPYKNAAERDIVAKKLREAHGAENGIFTLDINGRGKPTTSAYSNGFFEDA